MGDGKSIGWQGDDGKEVAWVAAGEGAVFALVIVPPGLIRNAESFLPFALPIVFVLFPSICIFYLRLNPAIPTTSY